MSGSRDELKLRPVQSKSIGLARTNVEEEGEEKGHEKSSQLISLRDSEKPQ